MKRFTILFVISMCSAMVVHAQIVISAVQSTTNGINFLVQGQAGTPYVVEASTDLSTWSPVLISTSTNSAFYFDDPAATNLTARFYRVISPQKIGLIPASGVIQAISLNNKNNTSYPTGQLGPALLSDNLWGTSYSANEGGQVAMNYNATTGLLTNSVALSQINMTGGVAGYPEVVYGYSPNGGGYSNPNSGLLLFPMKLGSLEAMEASGGFWSVVNYTVTPAPTPNPVDFAYDIWITSGSVPTGTSSTTVELMIFLYKNVLIPIGNTPRITGLPLPCLVNGQQQNLLFDVYASSSPGSSGVTVSFALETPLSTGSIGVDLSKITSLLGAELQGWYNNVWNQTTLSNYYILDVELGSEFQGTSSSADYNWAISNYYFLNP